jgi:hypothetical protein
MPMAFRRYRTCSLIGKDGTVAHVYRGYSEEDLPEIVADLTRC